jgi:transcriptional regulator with XRE-family HTH domain
MTPASRPDGLLVLVRQLAKMRHAAGLTQAQVAAELRTTQSAVAELETGQVPPTVATLLRYAALLGARVTLAVDGPNPGSQVEMSLPPAGTYSDDDTRAAARFLTVLVRYLNHATRHHEAVADPATVEDVAGSLEAAIVGCGQLLTQLANRLDTVATQPGVHTTSNHPAPAAGHTAADRLTDAQSALRRTRTTLTRAFGHTGHTGAADEHTKDDR